MRKVSSFCYTIDWWGLFLTYSVCVSTWKIDSHWIRGQSKTKTPIRWFRSGDQNGSRVRNKLVLCRRMCRYWPVWFEHRSPTNKHNCWNGQCYKGHVTRSGGYKNPSDMWEINVKCSIAIQYFVSILDSVFGIVREWRDYKVSVKITLPPHRTL